MHYGQFGKIVNTARTNLRGLGEGRVVSGMIVHFVDHCKNGYSL